MGSIVLVLQVAERRHGTIKYFARELRDVGVVCKRKVSQGPRPHKEGCIATQVGWKVTFVVTIDDVMLDLRPNGTGGRYL